MIFKVHEVMVKLKEKRKEMIKIGRDILNTLRFADVIVVLAESEKDIGYKNYFKKWTKFAKMNKT